MNRPVARIRAHAIADGAAGARGPSPVEVLVERGGEGEAVVLALGSAESVGRHEAAGRARLVDRSSCVLIPGLVNGHTHLDLTHIGCRAYDEGQGFPGFGRVVMEGRLGDDEGIERSVALGVERSLAGGVVAVGDIAGAMRTAAVRALRASPLRGVSYVELFGIGLSEARGIAFAREVVGGDIALRECGVAIGLSPHAPYSCSPLVYRECAALAREHGVPLATHAGETPEEREFITHGRGAFIDLLGRVGSWDESVRELIGHGASAIGHVAEALGGAVLPALSIAHVNDCSDGDMALLAELGASVVYCPRASAYFGQDRAFGPHRYRAMLDAGINVALGTDSIINLPEDQAGRLSTLDDARLLARRDSAGPEMLLAMCTTRGARALGLDEAPFRFPDGSSRGAMGGIAAVEVDVACGASPASLVMRSDAVAELVVGGGRWVGEA